MANILVIGNKSSVLVGRRGKVGLQGGHQIYWYTDASNHVSPEDENDPVTARLHSRFKTKALIKLAQLVEPIYINYLVRKLRVDLVHVHWANQLLIPFGIPRKIPVVVSAMGGDVMPDRSLLHNRSRFTITRMLKRASVITSKSQHMDEAIRSIDPGLVSKIQRINWGVDTTHFIDDLDCQELRDEWKIPEGSTIFFDMRSAKPFYRKEIIMEAFARIKDQINAVLMISEFNDGSDESQEYLRDLHNIAEEMGVTNSVRFVGSIPQNEIPKYYNLADIGISIPPSDGMPQSLFEMMACGTYPIIGDLKQYREVITNGNGATMVPVGTSDDHIEALADAMLNAAKNPGMRKVMATRNRNLVCEIANEKEQFRRMNSIYKELLESRKG